MLLDVAPVGALAYFGDDGDAEFGDVFHFVLDEGAEFFGFGGEDVEEEFVVDLEGHARAQAARGDFGVDAEHCELDEVGGGALQRRVDGGTLGESAHVGVARLDVGDGADAAEVRAHGLVAANGFEGLVDEAADAGVALEVSIDVGAGFLLVDAELRGQTERGDAVDDAEVDGLGAGSGLLVELGDGDAEDFGSGEGVDVLAGAVGVEQQRVLREVGHQAQLDLRVVGGHEQVAGCGDEGGANLAAKRGADGDVLQGGVGGGEAAGGGADLVEGGVYAAFGVDQGGQRVEVGGAELGKLAVFEDERGDGVMLGELFEDVLRGGDDLALAILVGLGQVHFVEEEIG